MAAGDPENTRREEVVYPALWRPRLWLGCHPVLLVVVGATALMMVPVGLLTHNIWWMAFGMAIMMVAMPFLRKLARYEPEIIEVLPRYQAHARHYSAVGSVGSRLPSPRRHQR